MRGGAVNELIDPDMSLDEIAERLGLKRDRVQYLARIATRYVWRCQVRDLRGQGREPEFLALVRGPRR